MDLLDAGAKPIRIFTDLLKLGVLIAFFWLSTSSMIYLAMREPTVPVPNLQGKTLQEAEHLALQVGLRVEVKNKVFDDRSPQNTVVEQWPRAGMTIKKGQSLRVNTSLGPRVARIDAPGEK